MINNEKLIDREKKYFNILSELLERNLGKIIIEISSQKFIESPTEGIKSNVIEKALENIIEGIISEQLGWNVCSLPISSDSCFECGDAIIHIDAKSVLNTDGDAINNKVNVEKSQTSYDSEKELKVTGRIWKAGLKHYEKHLFFGEIPNITFIVKNIYSAENLVEKIQLISLPNGQLSEIFENELILSAGKNVNRTNIRFLQDKLLLKQNWRVMTIFERKEY